MTSHSRRAVLAGALASAALAACGENAGAAKPGDRPSITVWRHKAAASHFMAAAGQGNTPYTVVYADLPGGNAVLNAYAADVIDYAFMSQIPPIFAQQAHIPLALLASYQGDTNNCGLLVRKGSAVRSVPELRGKTITYVPATNEHYYLLKLLDAHGMTMRDIQPVALPTTEANAAFEGGHIEARCCGGLTALQCETQLDGRWIVRSIAGLYSGNFVISARPAALADPGKRAAILDYLDRERATWAWVAANPKPWAAISAKLTSLPAALYERLAAEQSRPGNIVPPSQSIISDQQNVADYMIKRGLINGAIDVEKLWHRTA